MPTRRAIAMFVAVYCGLWIHFATVQAADPQPKSSSSSTGLAEGWKKDVDIPEWKNGERVLLPTTNLKLWVEQGWLIARYETPDRGLEWQVAMAQATDPQPPDVVFDNPAGFEVKYRQYFIREYAGQLRILRERKTNASPAWPAVPIEEGSKRSMVGWHPNLSSTIASWEIGDWRWLGSGLYENQSADNREANNRYDIWMLIQHKDLPPRQPRGVSVEVMPRVFKFIYGDYSMHDEGDLFIGERSLASEEHVRIALANILNGKLAPELSVKQWLNAPEEASLKKLHGKVVLLYFWNESSYQPFASILHKKFKDQGLVVIGVHPSEDSDGLGDLIKDRRVDLPIAIGTQRSYTVKFWPTYFLIDKTGNVRQGYLEHPPLEKDIEELLK